MSVLLYCDHCDVYKKEEFQQFFFYICRALYRYWSQSKKFQQLLYRKFKQEKNETLKFKLCDISAETMLI